MIFVSVRSIMHSLKLSNYLLVQTHKTICQLIPLVMYCLSVHVSVRARVRACAHVRVRICVLVCMIVNLNQYSMFAL